MRIEMKGIHKAFGGNQVLSGVDFDLAAGEVHALMGENGAGKSTLMNILTGMHARDEGTILIDGKETYFANPKQAERHGIAFIHQELHVWPEMTVLENMFIGRELSSGWGLLKGNKMSALAEEQFRRLSVDIPLNALAGSCSVGQQQMIEIAKALLADTKVIIMDEPTSALTEREIRKLFEVMEALKKEGVSIVYISHRMEEIFEICDRITVMRDGRTVDTKEIPQTSFDEVVRKMVGRELTERYPARTPNPGEVVLEVKHATRKGLFEDISFQVRAGEIVGFSGLMGAGRTEMMRALFGLDPLDDGEVHVFGKKVSIRKPVDAVKLGIGFITEDRKDEGLILDFSVRENMVLPSLDSFASKGLLSSSREKTFVDALIKRLQIKTHSAETAAGKLSGGNQQKVVIAKWVGIGPRVLILDEPTRGVDVGAKREIYQLMNELTSHGVAIIMVSSELPEVLGMSDRIVVVHEGRIAGERSREEATQENIMTLATGGL
ncbi:sugar ABC transporter ATP-binding protein [Paenibacillus glycanilyticus]|uniref:sugar ABC transporter ATP-binding protein n=1 Tax=Paenibacillus glycanilyticus TaxID=126569 RepID=UPI0020415C11|nr:sugar ABC transporter ATP-binding protein [Paenibacillus glycanilyticus]MCM3629902.1 sugar ABC transporter ATP-binding protein [Paenibacillus glycanilyticus]